MDSIAKLCGLSAVLIKGSALLAQADAGVAGAGINVGSLIAQMGSLGLCLYLLYHVLTITLPKIATEHREERAEWKKSGEQERAQLVASLSHCRYMGDSHPPPKPETFQLGPTNHLPPVQHSPRS